MKKVYLIIIFLLPILAVAQTPDQQPSFLNPQRVIIEDIKVIGNQMFSSEQLIAYTGFAKGDTITVPSDEVSDAIKKLWGQRYFSNVEVTVSNINDGKATLNIVLTERLRVSTWDFNGIRRGEKKELTSKISIRRGYPISDYTLNNSIDKIKEFYTEKGYQNVDVYVRQIEDTTLSNALRVVFEVNKGKKTKIKEITFAGNEEIKDKKLRRAMKDTKRKRISTIFKSSKFDPKKFNDDKRNLITYYNEKGYRNAEIISDSIYTINDKRIGIHINVKEGEKFYFRNIEWVGNTIVPTDALNSMLKLEKGDVYNTVAMNKMLFEDRNSIFSFYHDRGYLFFNMVPIETNIEKDSVDVEIRMREGEQASYNRIVIKGNTRTNERVIRREVLTRPSYLYSKSELEGSLMRLNQTQLFNPEKLMKFGDGYSLEPNPENSTADLIYTVEEKSNDQFELSGGWGAGTFVGTVGVRFTNFSSRRMLDLKAWKPIPTGDAQTLALRLRTNGKWYQEYSIQFIEPWLGGKKPISLSISAFYSIQTSGASSVFSSFSASEKLHVSGINVGIGKRLKWPDYNFSIYAEVAYQNYTLKDWSGYTFPFENGSSNDFSVKFVLGRNSLNDNFLPTSGSDISLGVQLTPPYSLFRGKKNYGAMTPSERYNWIEYHRWTFNASVNTTIIGKLILHARARFGYLGYYDEDLSYSPFQGFVLGGNGMTMGYNTLYGQETIGLRGYKDNSLTPMSTAKYASKVSYTGHVYDRFTVELRYPLLDQPSTRIYLLSFFEAGNAWTELKDCNPFEIKRSAGIGVRVFLPVVGMLGLDWGYGFDKVPQYPGAGGAQLHFIMGHQL